MTTPPLPPGLFAPYLLECLERDGAAVVGFGLGSWLALLAFVLLSGAIGWAAWTFSALAALLLLGINTWLVWLARAATRGGVARAGGGGDGAALWRRRHGALLPMIKLALFCLSFVVSNSVFFGAAYGPESCFFSRTGGCGLVVGLVAL